MAHIPPSTLELILLRSLRGGCAHSLPNVHSDWIAVEEFDVSYYIGETHCSVPHCSVYIYISPYGCFIYVR